MMKEVSKRETIGMRTPWKPEAQEGGTLYCSWQTSPHSVTPVASISMLQEYSEAGEQATSSGERAGQEEGEERLEERRGVAWVQGWREEGWRSAREQPGGRHT